MGTHPINLGLRFILELTALYAVGQWAWKQHEGWQRIVFAIGLPLILAVLWGVFAVPNDPSRSGHAPVPTPGIIRLILELAIFGLGAWALYQTGQTKTGLAFGLIVLLHYTISYDRIWWLLQQ